MKKKIIHYYNLATDLQKREGKEWYKVGHNFCLRVAKENKIDHKTVAAIVSALSPANKWHLNLINAESLIRAYRRGEDPNAVSVTTYNRCKKKAIEILETNAKKLAFTGTNYKTFCFFHNLAFPLSNRVTIDRWVIRLLNPRNKALALKGKRYLRVENEFTKAAKELGILPKELQAIVWIYIRDLPRKRKSPTKKLWKES